MYRVIVADDQNEVRGHLRSLLEGSEDFEIVGEASSGRETLRLTTLLLPDLVIADVDMPDQDGLDVTRYISDKLPRIKVVLVSIHMEREYERFKNPSWGPSPLVALSRDTQMKALAIDYSQDFEKMMTNTNEAIMKQCAIDPAILKKLESMKPSKPIRNPRPWRRQRGKELSETMIAWQT